MTTKTKPRYKETRTYSKVEDLETDIAKYSVKYPWYKQFVEDIRETMSARENHGGGYRITLPPR